MDEARVRFPTGARCFSLFGDCIVVLSQIVALLTRVRFPVSELQKDVVAEWLTRLTANQFLSGAQVRVLPTSFLLGLCRGSSPDKPKQKSWGRGFDPRVGLHSPTSSVGRAQDSYWFPFLETL
jgi:hypothetical protein